LLGGLAVIQDRYKLSGNSFTLQSLNQGKPAAYTAKPWKPEQVRTMEVGYKGLLGDRLLADVYAYRSNFTNFSAGQVVVQLPSQHQDPTVLGNKVFSFPSNSESEVITQGWGVSLDYQLGNNWMAGTNVSYNELKDTGGSPNFQLAFNTPNYRTNVSLSNRNIGGSGWGVSAVWRYQEKFVWQSSIVNQVLNQQQLSLIPAFHTLDMQVSKRLTGMKSILKVGGTNLGGKLYQTGWANPLVGSMYYVSLTFDELLN
jgi:outer membrane receptor protein involved in Fe transport